MSARARAADVHLPVRRIGGVIMQRLTLFSNATSPSGRAAVAARRPHASATPRVLIVGAGALGRATAQDVQSRGGSVIGFLSWEDDTTSWELGAPLLGSSDQLAACLAEHPIAEVYLAASPHHHGRRLDAAVQTCEETAVPFAVPAVPFRLTRAHARGTRAFPDGYLHFALPRTPAWGTMLHTLRVVTARAVALCMAVPQLMLARTTPLAGALRLSQTMPETAALAETTGGQPHRDSVGPRPGAATNALPTRAA